MLGLAYRTFIQERDHHYNSLTRSTQSTAREIELYIAGLKRALSIFAAEEEGLLIRVVSDPQAIYALRDKISLHFPEHLSFALSDPSTPSPLINEHDLFGKHCRSNIDIYANNDGSVGAELSIHTAGPDGTEHFDIMITFAISDSANDEAGILFLSFPVDELRRLLRTGSSSAHELFLGNLRTKPVGSHQEILLSAETPAHLVQHMTQTSSDYSLQVNKTPWVLRGIINTSETLRASNALILQAFIGTVALLIAGLTARRSIEQEKISRNRTAIVLDSIEAERKRIARDLHDQVLSDISHARRLLMELEPDDESIRAANADKLLIARRSVEQFSDSIRTAIDDLYPHTLENLGLCNSLESYLGARFQSGPALDFRFDSRVDRSMRASQKLHVFRIVTELIDNSIAHSKCTTIEVRIRHRSDSVFISVCDNGEGFDLSTAVTSGNHGLNNIESRVAAMAAVGRWTTGDSGGSCFELTLPVVPNESD